jgi:hypothetical protein
MSNTDFLANRLAAIEGEKVARAEMDRLNGAIPVLLNSIKEMRLARLSDQEIASFFRYAADELDTATTPSHLRC